ncbi:caldesmon-like [Palaemon carinicauda]|uniref:caldesmon-like n=1 Tax=Palaemon carinicauda TaxID=392227 RepID=UPI0035B66997
MDSKPKIPRVIFHGKNNNREDSNEQCHISAAESSSPTQNEARGSPNESHSYNSLSSEFSSSALGSSLDLPGEITSSSYNALNQTFTSEVFFEVHKVHHHETTSENGYSTTSISRGEGRDGTDYCESDESGCETETTLKASTERDTSEESSKTDIEIPRRSLFEEEYTNFGLAGWRGVELFIREEGDEGPPDPPRYGHFRSTGQLGLSVESVDSCDGQSEDENAQAKTDVDDTDCGKSSCEMELAQTYEDETDVTMDVGETDVDEVVEGETGFAETDLGETDFAETDIGETYLTETDIGETDFGETDIGETDLGETDLGETDIGETDIGETTAADAEKTDLEGKETERSEEQLDKKSKQDKQGNLEVGTHGELEIERPSIERQQKVRKMTREARGRAREEREQRLREKREKLSQDNKLKTVIRSRATSFSPEKDISRSSSLETKAEVANDLSIKKELNVMRSRLVNLRKVIHAKNEEIRELKLRMKIEKSSSNTQLATHLKERQKPGLEIVSTSELTFLRRELSALRQEKERLRAELVARTASEKEKAAELRRFKQQHERQLRASKAEAKREEVRECRESLVLQKSLEVKEKPV